MDCREAEKRIQPYVKGHLPEKELEAFLTHIRHCPACYEELETYFIVNRAMSYFDDEEQNSYNLTGLLERDLREKEELVQRHRKRDLFFKLLMGVLIIFFAVLALHYFEIIELPWLKGLL